MLPAMVEWLPNDLSPDVRQISKDDLARQDKRHMAIKPLENRLQKKVQFGEVDSFLVTLCNFKLNHIL
jgi:hypothetical protein